MKPLCPAAVFFALFGAEISSAQYPLAPEAVERAAGAFHPNAAERILSCAVHPLAPALTYRLIYRAGYNVVVPAEQLTEAPRRIDVLVRVTPKQGGAEPLLLKDSGTLPSGPEDQDRAVSKFEAQVRGGFYLGEGEYRVELVAIGGGGRVCRKQWDVDLKPRKGVRGGLAPGRVAALSQIGLPRLGEGAASLTVLLHAGAAKESPLLLQSLAAILDRIPFRRVRVVVFSLEQHKELLRQEVTDQAGFGRVAEAVGNYNPAVVSYGVLRDPAGHRDFLWQLLAKEGLRAPPSDAVLFLGQSTLDDTHMFVPPACAEGSQKTPYVYFEYAYPGRVRSRMPGAGPGRRRVSQMPDILQPAPDAWPDLPQPGSMLPVLPDAIARVTRACAGKVYAIYSPADLISAIEKTGAMLSRR
jgi:hypothetical protein